MDGDYLSIPMRLSAYRKLMKLNQTQMGEKLGVTQSHYCKQEAGLKGVTYRNLKTFEQNGGDISFLITGECRTAGRLEFYLDRCASEYGKTRIYEILVWASRNGQIWAEGKDGILTERTFKCIRLLENYSEDVSVWMNIRRSEDCSQADMAKIFDINIKRYRSIEKGISMPDAEILLTLHEKLHYSPLVIMDRERYYMDELNRIWELIPSEYLRELEVLLEQAVKIVHMLEKREMERKNEICTDSGG